MITIFGPSSELDDDPAEEASTAHMVSEFIREAAVLLFVFAPLDWVVQKDTSLTGSGVLGILLLSGAFLYIGIRVENTRQ